MSTPVFTELEKIRMDAEQCMKCGFCAYVCPVYQEEKIESAVARGKNELVKGIINGELDFSRELADRLYKCTACMACTESCPSKAPIPRIVVAARADAVNTLGVRAPYGFVYRNLLANRQRLGNLLKFARFFQSAFVPKTNGTIRHLPSFVSALAKGRRIPAIAPKFLRQQVGEVTKPPSGTKTIMRIGYFPGCMKEFVIPHIGKKTIDFLARHGVEVVMPREQGCCGSAAFLGAGDFETGKKIADVNVAAFSGVDLVVTGCATCACSLKEYPRFLADTPERQDAYTRFAGKVQHFSQFVTDTLGLPASSFQTAAKIRGKKLTWHDPCHLNRHLGIREQPRQILKSLEQATYIEMPDASRCCGMAGQFSLFYPELSRKIGEKKVENIEASDADIVVTECPGCQLQLLDSIARLGKPQKVMSLIELLD
jgi:glycolate oxidase iron-sulfur subunit